MSWVTCEPKSTMRILSCPASRSEPAPPRTREESRTVICRPMCDPLPARSRPPPAFTTALEPAAASQECHIRCDGYAAGKIAGRSPPRSHEHEIAPVDRRGVHERDDLV